MSGYIGDYALSTVIYGKFTTYRPSTGASFTLAGTPALSVYKDNSTTQSTSGVTLTADFDSVTGLNHFAIDTSSDGTFYSAGSNFDIVITTGTVDSVSVTGSVVASFSINKVSALRPTTAARTLDVSAGGEAGVDWANVGSPSTSVNLSATTINLVNTATTVTNQLSAAAIATGIWQDATAGDFTTASSIGKALYISNIVPGASGGHMISGSNAGTTTFGALTVTGATTFTGAIAATNASNDIRGILLSGTQTFNVTGNITGNLSGSVGSVTGNVGGNVTGSVGSVVGAVGSVTGAVGSVAGNVGGNVTGSVGSVVGDIGGLAAGAVTDVQDAVWDTVLADHQDAGSTGEALGNASAAGDPWAIPLPGAYSAGEAGYILGTNLDVVVSTRAALGDAMTLTSGGYNAAADALLGRNLAGGSSSGRIVSQALYTLRNKVDTGTGIVYQVDDTTPAFTFTVITSPSDPITVFAPA